MKKVKNRRTLKKRIRRAMSLTAFTTVLFLSGVIIYLMLKFTEGFANYQAEVVSYEIQRDISSGKVLKLLRIRSMEDLNENNLFVKTWVEGLDKNTIINEVIPFARDINKINMRIEIHDTVVYTNEDDDYEEMDEFFQDTESVIPVYDIRNQQIGSINVRVNPHILFGLVATILFTLIVLSIGALLIAKILSLFLIIPIINPIRQLEKKVKAIAEGDQETAANTQLELKRPLREIESLANSTNGIMKKLHGYNEMLENQKDALENQNSELEMQNEELIKSKNQIQEQQAQLIQSERMASVGLLTAAITHEINTPIGAINSNAQIEEMLLGELLSNSSVCSDEALNSMLIQLKEVNDINLVACTRIIEIIRSLKSYSRLDQADFQEANINEGIRSVLVLTNNLLKRRITVHEEYGDLPLVRCFPGQLNQVFMNIIVNASQAIEGEGEIFITTSQKEDDIYITIKDTGTGIAPENLTKLFDPGFTTKGVGVGLGIGLYISYNIIHNHNGEITINSELGKGAEFIIRLPINRPQNDH